MTKLTRWRKLLRKLNGKWDAELFLKMSDQSNNWSMCAVGDKIFQEFGKRVPDTILANIAYDYLTSSGRLVGYHFAQNIGKCNYDEAEKILAQIENCPIESLIDVEKYKKEVLVI